MRILEPTADRIRHVALSLRDVNVQEISFSATLPNLEALASFLVSVAPLAAGLQVLATDAGVPCAVLGAMPSAPGRATMIYLATDDFPAIYPAWRRWWVDQFVPKVLMQFRRVEFVGVCEPRADKWRRLLGFAQEGIARRYGKSGEDFGYWAWLHPEVDAIGGGLGSCPSSTGRGSPAHV